MRAAMPRSTWRERGQRGAGCGGPERATRHAGGARGGPASPPAAPAPPAAPVGGAGGPTRGRTQLALHPVAVTQPRTLMPYPDKTVILQWNADGIKSKKVELEKALSDLKPGVVAIQETKLKPAR